MVFRHYSGDQSRRRGAFMSAVILATGDLAMDRDDYDACFAGSADVLREADVVFGQLETSFAERGR